MEFAFYVRNSGCALFLFKGATKIRSIIMKPFLKYPGGKLKELPLVEQFKPRIISRYFEPFVGGASVYLNMNICNSFINDNSKDLYNLYIFIKSQNHEFLSSLQQLDFLWKSIETTWNFNTELFNIDKWHKYVDQTLFTKQKKFSLLENKGKKISEIDKEEIVVTAKKTATYMCIRDLYNTKTITPPLRTACFFFIREYCYSSMFRFNKNGEFNVPYGGRSYNLKYMTSKINQMQSDETIKYFENTDVFNLDFKEFLQLFDMNDNDFIFVDPPYDSEFSTYDNHPFDKSEQIRLANFLSETKANWLLIIKKTDFIYNLYKNFNVFEYDKNYLVSFKNRNNKEVKHLLITNYDTRGKTDGTVKGKIDKIDY